MNRLEEIVKTLKTHIGEGVETALDYLEQVLDHGSQRYNDFIQIKSRYNSLQRELLLGVLDHSTYDISRNNISKALLLLAEEITEKDLIAADEDKKQEEDKRGEVLYNVPDLMQINHEEKCTVRIAFEAEQLLRDWDKTEEDVIKNIRVSEIMAVSLLNVDESDPPFAIRSFSETVQFVDKDDFTEWVFYVKPLKTGRFPLVLRVSVIEMINNKEYKKDIVLEEEITVQSEEVPQPGEAQFKSAGTSLTLSHHPIAGPEAAPPAAQAQEAGKKGLKGVAGALVAAAALAMAGWFGVQAYYNHLDDKAFDNARKGGSSKAVEQYIEQHPDGRHIESARAMLDSLNAVVDTLPGATSTISEPDVAPPNDTASSEGAVATAADGTTQPNSNKSKTPPPPGKKKTDTAKKKSAEKKKDAAPVLSPQQPATMPKEPAPEKPASSPILKGETFTLGIPIFNVAQNEAGKIDFMFQIYNKQGEVAAMLASPSDIPLENRMSIAFMQEGGAPLSLSFEYVGKSPNAPARNYGYLKLTKNDLNRLANEKFGKVRLSGKLYSLTSKGRKDLSKKAKETLKKLEAVK